jgi:hypothetical protein
MLNTLKSSLYIILIFEILQFCSRPPKLIKIPFVA